MLGKGNNFILLRNANTSGCRPLDVRIFRSRVVGKKVAVFRLSRFPNFIFKVVFSRGSGRVGVNDPLKSSFWEFRDWKLSKRKIGKTKFLKKRKKNLWTL